MTVDQRRGPAPQQASPLAVLPRQQAPIARTAEAAAMALERVVTMGDLAALQPEERVAYYLDTCQSLGLNPRSRPFDWLLLDGKVVLYPNKACADQLRAIHRIRIETTMPTASPDGSMLMCEAKGIMPDGRYDVGRKFVPLTAYSRERGEYRLRGKELANAYMKAETGAKRRVTFSLIGMAAPPQDLDDVEYKVLTVDGRGNILDRPTVEQKALAERPDMARAIGEPTFEDLEGAPTAFDGMPDQRPQPDPGPQKREGPRPSFRSDKARWAKAWGALVKGTYLDDDDARHRYVEAYTSTWPEAARTDSLSRLMSITTDVQMAEFIEHTRAHLDERAAAERADPDGELDGIDGVTPEQADAIDAAQRGEAARPMADLSDEEIEARFEQSTERLIGRPRAEEQGPTRTQLLADLRAVVEQVTAAGGGVDLPDDLTALDDAAVAAWTAELKRALDGLKAAL